MLSIHTVLSLFFFNFSPSLPLLQFLFSSFLFPSFSRVQRTLYQLSFHSHYANMYLRAILSVKHEQIFRHLFHSALSLSFFLWNGFILLRVKSNVIFSSLPRLFQNKVFNFFLLIFRDLSFIYSGTL